MTSFNTLATLFEELGNHRPEDVPMLQRKLEQHTKQIKSYDFTDVNQTERVSFFRAGARAYFSTLSSAKLARSLYKILKSLPKDCEEILIQSLRETVDRLIGSGQLLDFKTLSLLLDQNRDAQLYSQTQFDEVTSMLRKIIGADNSLAYSGRDRQDYLHFSAKLCVQVLQLFPQKLQEVLAVSLEDRATVWEEWAVIIACLISHLTESKNRDHLLLVGTALAMMLNNAPTLEETVSAYIGLLSLLACGRSFTFEFCGMRYSSGAAAIEEDCRSDPSLSVIALIKGLLVSCNKTTLQSGDFPLIVQIFPHILDLCKGSTAHHYLAFQLLALWWEKAVGLVDLHPSADCLKCVAIQTGVKKLTCREDLDESQNHREESQSYDWGDVDSCTPETSSPLRESVTFMSSKCPVLDSTLSCVWLNWESPVDGVSEYVLQIFRQLLSIWDARMKAGRSDYNSLSNDLFHRVLSLSWHVKSRYRPLAELLPYISNSSQIIEENPVLKDELLLCMKTNSLASIASDTYKAFILQMGSRGESSKWCSIWLSTLINGLASNNLLQRLKVSTYWLGPTLTVIPESKEHLLRSIESQLGSDKDQHVGRDLLLYAWVAVSRVARENFQACKNLEGDQVVGEALASVDELVRAEAFHLISSTLKKSEPMSEVELSLLKEFLPLNLKTDSASFRHNLASALRKVLVRIRDSCLSALQNKVRDTSFVDKSLEFVDWLYRLLMFSLTPGSSYQRRQTSFDMLFAFLETLVYQKEEFSRKGKAQENSELLVRYAQTKGLWDFFNWSHFCTLLTCVEDGAEEIQKLSYKLLSTYFPWPKELSENTNTEHAQSASRTSLPFIDNASFVQHLVSRAFHLIAQPRAYENHSGLLLFSLVLKKYILKLGVNLIESQQSLETFVVDASSPTATATQDTRVDASSPTATATQDTRGYKNLSVADDTVGRLLDLFMGKIEQSLNAVTNDIASGVKTNQIHGLLQCITRCLQDLSQSARVSQDIWGCKLLQLVHINQRLISLILDILSGGKSQADCPSFADIGSAIESLVTADDDDGDSTTTLSPEFQRLLSWCWINLKESCACLAAVTAIALLPDSESHLEMAAHVSVGETLIKVLTTCRHRGAIEGCRSNLFQFSFALMSCKVTQYADIPRSILHQVLEGLSQNSLTASVTRRSAGLPIIIQTILQAACKCGDIPLLISTVEELYMFAIEPLPESHNQQHDLRQSHALNVLKSIFCDASLAPRLMALMSKMVILVIESFDSPSWAMRNAATQLISTLVTRIFGQRSRTSPGGSMSVEEFSALYPDVLRFMCDKLQNYLQSATTLVRPSLYVMLTLLANLGASPQHQQTEQRRMFLQRAAEFFLASPVYSLRKLAAQVWVALSPLDQAGNTVRAVLDHVEQEKNNINRLHGWMLCLNNTLTNGQISCDAYLVLLNYYVKNQWLFSIHPTCLLVTSIALHTIQEAVVHLKVLDAELLRQLWSLTQNCLTNNTGSTLPALQLAQDEFVGNCLTTLLVLMQASKNKEQELSFLDISLKGLRSENPQLRSAILDCLLECIKSGSIADEETVQAWDVVMNQANDSEFVKSVEILLVMASKDKIKLSDCIVLNIEQGLTNLGNRGTTVCKRKAIFDVEGIVVGHLDDERLLARMKEVRKLCQQQIDFSRPTNNESMRLSAAISLKNCGPRLVTFFSTHQDSREATPCLTGILRTALTLLEDTEEDVRQETSAFISKLCNQRLMHYSVAYRALSNYIGEKLAWSSGIFSFLLHLLYGEKSLTEALTNVLNSGNRAQVMFEPETKSAMSEGHVLLLWAFASLQKLMQANCDMFVNLLDQTATAANVELMTNLPVIQKSLQGQPVFNVSNDEDVLTTLLGILLLGNLCESFQSSLVDMEQPRTCIVETIAKFQKIPNLHPFLQRENFKSETSSIHCLFH